MTLLEANKLVEKYIELKEKVKKQPDEKNKEAFLKHERLCLDKFRYIVLIKTNKYKQFANYDDLNQEGLNALLKALNSFRPEKGNWFWWVHKYVDTRVSRVASLHTAMKFPLRVAKLVPPQRLNALPIMIDRIETPETIYEKRETWNVIKNSMSHLTQKQKKVVAMIFGIEDGCPQSFAHVSQQLHISKAACLNLLNQAIIVMQSNIKL